MLEKFVIPQNTRFEEGSIVVEGDVIIGPGCFLGYGIIGKKIIVGEKTTIEGDIMGEEVRLDAWSVIKGNVVSKGDAYIGEFASIEGKLTIYGDLEIGRNVRIKEGFEAKGLITIQDPLPILIFIFLYLLELLRLGRLEEAEKLFEAEEFESPLMIPENSVLNLEKVKTDRDMEIVSSRVLGNLKARDVIAESSEIFGSLRGREIIAERSRIHGAIEGKTVYVTSESEVFGYIKAEKVYMEEGCAVEGMIIGRDGVWIKPKIEVEKVEAKAAKLEVVEDVEAKGDATNVRVESGEVQKDVS
jgi:predicted acyltransferase (DUF342 family)